jgi:AcrR family transcriptional regulator
VPSHMRRPVRDMHAPSSAKGIASARRARRQGGNVVEMQRRRLITATLELVYERGVQAVTIALVSDRAGVSRKTFYDSFDNREGCLLAAFDEAVSRAVQVVEQASEAGKSWCERVRAGLAELLRFLEEEPVVGHLLIVDALGAGEQTLNARRSVLARIIAVVDKGREEPKAIDEVPPLTAEGVVGAVFSVIHARMLERSRTGEVDSDLPRLSELVGPLAAMIVQPYLGPVAAKRELRLRVPAPKRSSPKLPVDPFRDLPIRLTYRTAQVLAAVATGPGASSKQIADASGVTDEGQMSRLLTRLERVGLIKNNGVGPLKGKANAWALTARGESVHTVIAQQTGQS